MNIPELQTDRLLLRAPHADDFMVYRNFYSDECASSAYGGPLSPELAWRKLAYDRGHWALRGFGMWSVVDRATKVMVGSCGIVWPEGWPRHELTWWILPASRRRRFAYESSRAAISWAYDFLGWREVETHMDDENMAARRLAKLLGGKFIRREQFPDGYFRSVYLLPPP